MLQLLGWVFITTLKRITKENIKFEASKKKKRKIYFLYHFVLVLDL